MGNGRGVIEVLEITEAILRRSQPNHGLIYEQIQQLRAIAERQRHVDCAISGSGYCSCGIADAARMLSALGLPQPQPQTAPVV